MLKKLLGYFFLANAMFISGCGGGGSSASSSATPLSTLTGYVIDAAVSGLAYDCHNRAGNHVVGITDSEGRFQYLQGGFCNFSIANIRIGHLIYVPRDGIVTPYEIAGIDRRADVNDHVARVAQFFQSIDDPSDGVISIPGVDTTRSNNGATSPIKSLMSVVVKQSPSDMLSLVQEIKPNATSLVDQDVAMQRMKANLVSKNVDRTLLMTTSTYDNSHWMGDMAAIIGGKNLQSVMLPGTHESGTYGILSDPEVSQTQTQNFTTQLNDGIRYFDLRVGLFNGASRECSEPGDWKLWHQTGTIIDTESVTLFDALGQIRQYLINQKNQLGGQSKEILILDLQNIEPNPPNRAWSNDNAPVAEVLSEVQRFLGPWLISTSDASRNWPSGAALNTIWNANSAEQTAKSVIVLVGSQQLGYARAGGCGVSVATSNNIGFSEALPNWDKTFDPQYFYTRESNISSQYNERQGNDVDQQLKGDLASQLQLIFGDYQKMIVDANWFQMASTYMQARASGMLTVLQYIGRPTDGQFAAWMAQPNGSLLWWASNLNLLLNYFAINGVDNDDSVRIPNQPLCANAWLSKRLQVAARHATSMPNIVIIDHYDDPSVPWFAAIWSHLSQRWSIRNSTVYGSTYNFVNFIKDHNSQAGSYQYTGNESNLNWEDTTCLDVFSPVVPGPANDYQGY